MAASAMRVLVVDSSAGRAMTGFVGMVSCGRDDERALRLHLGDGGGDGGGAVCQGGAGSDALGARG